jgi:type VI secretion system secreted protein VgrG
MLQLSFASGEDSLSVRHFTVSEGLSTLFDVSVVALSPLDDIDFETIVGQRASLHVEGEGLGHARTWTGICRHFEQIQAEDTGLSTYVVRVVPELWLLGQRHDCRIFQHQSVPEIVREVLSAWKIHPTLELHAAAYPKHEYRVQYAESDLAFVSRLLEEAGITYRFEGHGKESELVLSDAPHRREPRAGGPIPFHDQPSPEARHPFVTRVTAAREIRPGAFAIRDFDFRRRTDYELVGKGKPAAGVEGKLEQYHYRPGAFVIEKAGHDAHADEKEGAALASRSLEAERAARHRVGFHTNLIDLAPGTIFSMSGHPRARLGPHQRLLCTELSLHGTQGAELTVSGKAVPADEPYRPPQTTPRPTLSGVQSALVVGPEGEEIHTDGFGRVRVQFHWDRHGKLDDHSSCWIRVSQGWAGSGFGMMVIPRVGQEVTVGFFEGDPDQPIVIGRVHNSKNPVPYALPEHKTRSAWRSRSTPGGDDAGYNEILFEDRAGAELFSIHAERDLHKLVKATESERTGADRTVAVGRNRSTTVGGVDSTLVGTRHAVTVNGTSIELTDRRIVCTTGEATVTFDGPDLSLEARGNITIVAHDGDVVIKGGPNVKINSA